VLALKKGLIIELKWNVNEGNIKGQSKQNSMYQRNINNNYNAEVINSSLNEKSEKEIKLDNDNNINELNQSISNNINDILPDDINNTDTLLKKVLTATLLIKVSSSKIINYNKNKNKNNN